MSSGNAFYIGDRLVSNETAPLVIVEIGINHSGSLKTAFEMVDAAHEAGAELIKHQTHVVEDEMSAAAKSVVPGNADVSIYEIMDRCALNEEEEYKLKEYTESKGMIFISTPFSRAAADRLRKFDVPAYKIGSGECNNYPLVDHIASFGKPIILSTGMNSIESVRTSVEILRKHKVPYALLHCTNVYPTPHELVRLGAINELKEHFPDAIVGLSDHTVDNYACLGAVAVGASIVERHFTDRMDRNGPDIECSMDPQALKDLIHGSNILAKCRGGRKGPVAEEQVTIDFAFATVVTIAPVKKGERFTRDNIWVKRPGTGEIPAEYFENILGSIAATDMAEGHHLCHDEFVEG
ncbi:polyhydroxyalkanoate biosynthesis repressor PhaR [Marinifilum sp. JC120]|nr:polyhydroxyalkanoate biosynthesis repressor PhaR [Marinifilum sp. JC120]